MEKLYYIPPEDEIFKNLKYWCIAVWNSIDGDKYEINESVKRLNNMGNIGDNFMTMLAMFDNVNIVLVSQYLNQDTRKAIYDRLISVNDNDYTMYFR